MFKLSKKLDVKNLPPLPPAELKPAWIKDIANKYAQGFPLERLAMLYNLPPDVINGWIEEAQNGNPEYADLKKALAQAAAKHESELLSTLGDLALGRHTTKTTKTIRDGQGNILRIEETESTVKPDTEAIKALLALKSSHYKTTEKQDINVNSQNQIQVVLVDNGRKVDVIDD